MPARIVVLVWLLVPTLFGAGTGCATARWMREARQAEQSGRCYRAHDLYCAVLLKKPTDKAAAMGADRVSLKAAQQWEEHGLAAMKDGDYELAWLSLMQALMIRPDLRSVASRITALERDHPEAVADAKRRYLEFGPGALASAGQPGHRPRQEDQPPGPRVARADQAARPALKPTPPSPAPPPAKPPVRDGSDKRAQPDEDASEPDEADARARSKEQAPPHLFTGTVSRDDKRFPKLLETIDGLIVKLGDTDPDPDADMEVYVGRRRIAKRKNWRAGQPLRVSGHSGRSYDIVILAILDETETVRFAIRPAN